MIVAKRKLKVIEKETGIEGHIFSISRTMIFVLYDRTSENGDDGIATSCKKFKTLQGKELIHPNRVNFRLN